MLLGLYATSLKNKDVLTSLLEKRADKTISLKSSLVCLLTSRCLQ